MTDRRNPGAIDYFDRRIEVFDKIYQERKGFSGWLDRTVRASVRIRFNLAFELMNDMSGKSVLDIGCGTGRYMFEAAKHGATDILGLDAAEGALESARTHAKEAGLANKMKFQKNDFLDFRADKKYDIVLAVGYYDYILEPLPHIKKMLEINNGNLFMSFPKLWHPLTPIRKIRLMLNNCPIRFYSLGRVNRLMKNAGCDKYEIHKVARDYIVFVKN